MMIAEELNELKKITKSNDDDIDADQKILREPKKLNKNKDETDKSRDDNDTSKRNRVARKSLLGSSQERGRRRSARFSCCVPKCHTDEKSLRPSGKPVRFFDMPDSGDRRLRRQWMQAVPELEFGVSPVHRKICERHFIDGRPTDHHPCPELLLGDDNHFKTKKRKYEADTSTTRQTRSTNGQSVSLSPSPSHSSELKKIAKGSGLQSIDPERTDGQNVRSPPQQDHRLIRLTDLKETKIITPHGDTLPKGIQILAHRAVTIKSPDQFEVAKRGITARPSDQTVEKGGKSPIDQDWKGPTTRGKRTLQSVLDDLQQHQQKQSLLKNNEQHGSRPGPPPPVVQGNADEQLIMCGKCAGDLPVLRKNLGRLESRLESMISMVRTLCQRQRVQLLNEHDKGISDADTSKLLPSSSTSINSNATIVSTNKDGSDDSLSINPGVKRIIRIPLSLSLRDMKKNADKKVKVKGKDGAKVQDEAAGSSDDERRLHIVDTVDQSSKKTMKINPKKDELHLMKLLARSLLLLPGSTLTIEEFRQKGPQWARNTPSETLGVILRKLNDQGLLHLLDEHLDPTKEETAFEKESNITKLANLSEYGLAMQTYLNSFTYNLE